MHAPQSCPIPRANAHTRKRRPRRRRTPIWPAILAVVSIGVIVATAAAVMLQRGHRGRSEKPAEVATAPAVAPPARMSSSRLVAPPVSRSLVEHKREPAVVVDSIRYRKAPPTADELTVQLASVRELGLQRTHDDPLLRETIVKDRGRVDESRSFHPYAMVMPDVHTLPLRMGPDCHLADSAAVALQTCSRRLREHMAKSADPCVLRRLLDADREQIWRTPAAVPTLVQMLQAEGEGLRRLLVELLTRIDGPEASRALAGRAVFDVSADLRHAAIRALEGRRKSEFRDVLLQGLRHSWPEAADFAAAALVALRDREAGPALVSLLDEPNPAAPFAVSEDGEPKYYVRELVRVNHLRNCIVCHAISRDQSHFVRASIPDETQVLPPAFTPAYYRGDTGQLMVRADVTYLRQDFSLPQPVADHGVWPAQQRYDYCVRTRPLSIEEWEQMRRKPAPYPQRESVLFALRELTGFDRGDGSAEWGGVAMLRR